MVTGIPFGFPSSMKIVIWPSNINSDPPHEKTKTHYIYSSWISLYFRIYRPTRNGPWNTRASLDTSTFCRNFGTCPLYYTADHVNSETKANKQTYLSHPISFTGSWQIPQRKYHKSLQWRGGCSSLWPPQGCSFYWCELHVYSHNQHKRVKVKSCCNRDHLK